MKDGKRPLANPLVILREEFDDWAILFNPDTGHGFGLSPAGAFVWKLLDGGHTIDALLAEVRRYVDNVPEEATAHIRAFIDALVAEGLAGYGEGSSREKCSPTPLGALNDVGPFTYEPPKLIDFSGQTALGACSGGSSASCCNLGHLASSCDPSGSSGSGVTNCTACSGGSCVHWDDTNCTCVGSCNDACNCGGCVPPYPKCCYGSCANNEACGAGCCDDVCGSMCYRPCEGGCSHIGG